MPDFPARVRGRIERPPGRHLRNPDTQAEVTLATELGISGVPTVRAYRDGVQLMDHSGPMTLAMITSVVSQLEDLDVDDVIERALAREPLPAIRLMP